MGHWVEKKEDFFILSQEVKDADTSSMALLRASPPQGRTKGRKLKIYFSLN